MAHHGANPFINSESKEFLDKISEQQIRGDKLSSLSKLLSESVNTEGLGPTGAFPEGSIDKSDDGEIAIGITNYKGNVILNFGTPTAWIGFTAEQAREIAKMLNKHADAINPV